MPWIQITLQAQAEFVEPLSDALLDQGALSVTYQDAADQPLFEPPPGETPIWSDTRITGLFEAQSDVAAISSALKQQHPEHITALRSELLEDRDWIREWMTHYEPMHFGDRLWIVPSHHTPPDPEGVNILLDPGLAFGTGTHPTTALCLRWLAKNTINNQYVIDYGCGSGILAIAAARLAARQVLAIDNDPQALLATRDNARRNEVSERIHCSGVDNLQSEPADILMANILAGPLITLAQRFSQMVRPGGTIVLSGILAEQAHEVAAAYARWFDMQPPLQQDDWVQISGQRHTRSKA